MLDEFALILHLHDVYWEEEGRASVDAVFIAVAVTGLLLVGLRPLTYDYGTSGEPGRADRGQPRARRHHAAQGQDLDRDGGTVRARSC